MTRHACRVSARAELSLRQRLSQREDRISELKDALAAAKGSLPGPRSATQPTLSRSPRSCLTTIPDHSCRSRPESHSHTDTQTPRDRPHYSHAQQTGPSSGLEEHPALSPEDADQEEQVSQGQLPRHHAQPAQNRVGAEESHEPQRAAAHRTAFKLPYFQSKPHAAAEMAVNSLAPPQIATLQQTAAAHADHASQDLPSKSSCTQGMHLLRTWCAICNAKQGCQHSKWHCASIPQSTKVVCSGGWYIVPQLFMMP